MGASAWDSPSCNEGPRTTCSLKCSISTKSGHQSGGVQGRVCSIYLGRVVNDLGGGIRVSGGVHVRRSLLNAERIPTSTCCNIRALETVRGFCVDGGGVDSVPRFIHNVMVIGGTTTVTGGRLRAVPGDMTGTVVTTYSRILGGKGYVSRFPMSICRNNTNASMGVGAGRILTGVNLRLVNRRGNRCRCLGPGSRIGGYRSAGSTCPANFHVTICSSLVGLMSTVGRLHRNFRHGTIRFRSVLGVNHARLRSTMPVALNRRFHTFDVLLGRRIGGVRHATRLLLRIGLNTATVNANLGAPGRCSPLTIGGLTRIANFPYMPTRSLVRTASSYNTCIVIRNTLGHLTIGVSGVYGSLHLLSSNPHTNLGRVGLPRLRTNSSVVPTGMGPIIPRIIGRMYFGIVNGSAAIAVTTRTNRLRLGIVRPIVNRTVFRSIRVLAGTYCGLLRGYVGNVATGGRIYRNCICGSVNVIACLGPFVNRRGNSVINGVYTRANGDMHRIILRHNLLARTRLSSVFSMRGLVRPTCGTGHCASRDRRWSCEMMRVGGTHRVAYLFSYRRWLGGGGLVSAYWGAEGTGVLIMRLVVILLTVFLNTELKKVNVNFTNKLKILILTTVNIGPNGVPFSIVSVVVTIVTTVSTVRITNNLSCLIRRARGLLHHGPGCVAVLTPVIACFLAVFTNANGVSLTALPIVTRITGRRNIGPYHPLSATIMSTRVTVATSPVSTTIICVSSIVRNRNVDCLRLLSIIVPSALLTILIVSFLIAVLFGSGLSSSPVCHGHLRRNLIRLHNRGRVRVGSNTGASI